MSAAWQVGQTVEVQSRTWAGINKEGGCAKITKVHYTSDGAAIASLDVKYVVSGGCEKDIDPAIVSAYEILQRGGRKRRGRDFLIERAHEAVKKITTATKRKGGKTSGKQDGGMVKSQSRKQKKRKPAPPKRKSSTMKREEVSPLQSPTTSMSTPVTPEKEVPKKVEKQKIKEVVLKSVPKVVFTDSEQDISPLSIDRVVAKAKKQDQARRGLFGSTSGAKVKSAQVFKKKKKNSMETNVISYSKKKASVKSKKKQPAVIAPEKGHSTISIDAKELRNAKATLVAASAKAPIQFSRTSKPAKSKMTLSAPKQQKPLKDVYQHEVKRATDFVDNVIGARDEDAADCEFPKAAKKPSAETRRYEEFLSIFQKLLPKFDDNMIEEDRFCSLVEKESTTKQAFSADDVNQYIGKLSREGKLMKSDGMLYFID